MRDQESVLCLFSRAPESTLRDGGHSWEWAGGSESEQVSLPDLPPARLCLPWVPPPLLSLLWEESCPPQPKPTLPCWVSEPSPVATTWEHWWGEREHGD